MGVWVSLNGTFRAKHLPWEDAGQSLGGWGPWRVGGAQQVCKGSRDPGAEAKGPGLPAPSPQEAAWTGARAPGPAGSSHPSPVRGEAPASLGLKPRPQPGTGGRPPRRAPPRAPAPLLQLLYFKSYAS